LCSCDQEYDEDTGQLLTIMGCMFVESRSYLRGCWLTRPRTDISAQKHAEEDAVARANLVEKLALRTQEAAFHEKNFQQIADLAPCGMHRTNDINDISDFR
jgi:hypothetical protein